MAIVYYWFGQLSTVKSLVFRHLIGPSNEAVIVHTLQCSGRYLCLLVVVTISTICYAAAFKTNIIYYKQQFCLDEKVDVKITKYV